MENKYTNEWFEKRAVESIRPIGQGVWDFSDSLLLYSPQSAEEYENIQKEGDPYHELVTAPETKYLSEIADKLASELPNNFYYIDLGPGTEHKEKYFFDALKKQGKNFVYYPVDINSHFLELAKEFSENNGIKTVPIMSPFEECRQFLPDDGVYRFVSIGATFANYHIQEMFSLLSGIIGVNGSAFINAHIRERLDMERVREIYSSQAISIVIPKLNLVGLNQEDIEVEANDKVEDWVIVKNPSTLLAEKGIKSGDRLLVFQSLRYGLDDLRHEIAKAFPSFSMFDIGSTFVGFLLKK